MFSRVLVASKSEVKSAGAPRQVGNSDSGAIPERFKSDSDLEERFGKAGVWVSERFERDHCLLV